MYIKLQELIAAEKEAETARIVERVQREGGLDLEATEFYIRTSLLSVGASVLERLLQTVGVGRQPMLSFNATLISFMRQAVR